MKKRSPRRPTIRPMLANASLFFAEVGRIEEAVGWATAAGFLRSRSDVSCGPTGTAWARSSTMPAATAAITGTASCALWPENRPWILWGRLSARAVPVDRGPGTRFDELVDVARRRGFDSPTDPPRGHRLPEFGFNFARRDRRSRRRASWKRPAADWNDRVVGLDTLGRLHALGLARRGLRSRPPRPRPNSCSTLTGLRPTGSTDRR